MIVDALPSKCEAVFFGWPRVARRTRTPYGRHVQSLLKYTSDTKSKLNELAQNDCLELAHSNELITQLTKGTDHHDNMTCSVVVAPLIVMITQHMTCSSLSSIIYSNGQTMCSLMSALDMRTSGDVC